MSASSKLHVSGPYDNSGNKYGPDIDFYLAQEATDTTETDTKPQSIPTQESDETILAPLQGKRSLRWQGKANGNRLYQAGYGTGPKSALINWLIEAESLISPEQGRGYEVVDDERGETFSPGSNSLGVLFESFRWTYEVGSGTNAEWTLEGTVTDGMQKPRDRNKYINSPKNRGSFDEDIVKTTDGSYEFPLGELTERAFSRSIDLRTQDMVHQTDVPTVGISESGVKTEVTLEGRITRNNVSNLETSARQIVSDFHGREVDFEDSLMGRSRKGAIGNSSTTLEAGRPDITDYRIEIRVGETARN